MDEENKSTAAPRAAGAPNYSDASTTTISSDAPLSSDDTIILVPATLEPHPINVARMPVPTHDMQKCSVMGCWCCEVSTAVRAIGLAQYSHIHLCCGRDVK